MKKLLMFLVMGLFLFSFVSAQQTVKTIQEELHYDNAFRPNEGIVTIPIQLDAPDGIYSIEDFVIEVNGNFINPSTFFDLNVTFREGVDRNCRQNDLTSPDAVVYDYNMKFDCTNRADRFFQRGKIDINLTISTDSRIDNLYVSYRMTYLNNRQTDVIFGATDYFTTEPSQLVFVQLIDSANAGQPIDNAVCYTDVYESDATTLAISDAPMVHTQDGIYHYFTALTEPGVHIATAECFYDYDQSFDNVTSTTTTNGNYERLSGFVDYNFFYDDGDETNYTTEVQSPSGSTTGNLNLDWDRFAKINTTGTFYNDDVIRIYGNCDNQKRYDYTNAAGTVSYGTFTPTQCGLNEWWNVTLSGLGAGVSEIYLSDVFSGAGGPARIDFEYIEIEDPTGGGWSGDPDTLNTLSNLFVEDDLYWYAVEDSSDRLDIEFTFGSITGTFNETGNLYFNGKWSENSETLNISVYNYSSSSWYKLPNSVVFSTVDTDANNQIPNVGDFISSNTLLARLEDSGADNTNYGELEINRFVLELFTTTGSFVDDVKGGGEIHIINTSLVAGDVWSAPTRSLTELNFDTTDEEAIWEYEGNVSENLTNTFTESFWNYNGTINLFLLDDIAEAVWSYVTRTLTDFTFEVNTTINESELSTLTANDVWNYSEGRYTHGVEL